MLRCLNEYSISKPVELKPVGSTPESYINQNLTVDCAERANLSLERFFLVSYRSISQVGCHKRRSYHLQSVDGPPYFRNPNNIKHHVTTVQQYDLSRPQQHRKRFALRTESTPERL